MRVELDIRKSVEENAAGYFEKAKKSKHKIDGVKKAIATYEEKFRQTVAEHEEKKQEKQMFVKARKPEWYEKFRWFFSSDGFLVIGGKDATTNEIIIKKYSEKDDVVFHTDMAGSPFVVVKREEHKGQIPERTLQEAADFTAVFSRGWKRGMGTLKVFWVHPDQVSKTPRAGEFLTKGSFVIYGETNYVEPQMSYALGSKDGKMMGGPLSAVKAHCAQYVEIVQGDEKISDTAKAVKKAIGGELDEIIRALPQNSRVKKK